MLSFKWALVLLPLLGIEVGFAQSEKAQSDIKTPKTIILAPTLGASQQKPLTMSIAGTSTKAKIFLPLLEPKPYMEAIVGYTDSGLPITHRQRAIIEMGKKLAKIQMQREAREVKAGLRQPRVRRDLWAEKQAEIDERERLYGKATTQSFILPGTTPEQSRAIHAKDAGLMLTQGEGKSEKWVYTKGSFLTSDSNDDKRVDALYPNKSALAVTVSNNVVAGDNDKGVLKHIPSHQPRNEEDQQLPTAERVLESFFPDVTNVSWGEVLVGLFVGNAHAQTLHQQAKAVAKDKETLPVKELSELLPSGQMNDEKAIAMATEMAKQFRDPHFYANPINEKGELKNPDPLKAFNGQKLTKGDDNRAPLEEKSAPETKANDVTYIFVSYSLGDDTLKAMMKRNAGKAHTVFVMRGIPEGMGLGEGIRRMQALASQVEPMPNIIIDPMLFTLFGIKAVPSVVRATTPEQSVLNKDAKPTLIAKVEGLHNDAWLLDRVSMGHTGDLGQQGPIKGIDEPDMIEMMKKRILAIDWEEKKTQAVKRFWQGQTFDVLPQATEYRVRTLDPSVFVTHDIKDMNGNVIQAAGTTINPLKLRPFNTALIIFNPLRAEEVALVQDKLKTLRGLEKRIQLLVTQMDRKRGWDAYTEITERFDEPIFLLTPEVKARFEIEVTPSLVTADNKSHVFVIEELAHPKEKP